MKYDVAKGGYILLGRCGENLARTVELDVAGYLEEFPGASITLWHRRCGETDIYPVVTGLSDGCIVWKPTSADTACEGDGEAEVRVTVNGVIAKSKILLTVVKKSLSGQEAEPPEASRDWVDKVLGEVESVEKVVAAETERAKAETARQTAETARAEAETERADTESSRTKAETSRDTAEAARADAETARDKAEAIRKSAETERADAEKSRISAESSRATAEDARDDAERERIANENARKSAETSRGSAETVRVSAEKARADAEQNRASAETVRANAEGERTTAETARANAESERVSAETARANAETARVSAETARANAESERVANEAARQALLTAAVNSASASAEDAETSAGVAESSATTASAKAEAAAESATSAFNAMTNAQEAEEAVEGFVETIAKEPTAQSILSVMQQELTLLQQIVEEGTGGKGSLNGFSFSRGDDGEVVISYTNPDDETDTAEAVFATDSTAALIAAELKAINNSLYTIAGTEASTNVDA